MKRVSYMGVFFDEETKNRLIEKQKNKLPIIAPDMHCTFKYAPTKSETREFFKLLGGRNIDLKITGYASDGMNSGFSIELTPEQRLVYTNDIMVDGMREIRPAHITVSMEEGAYAVNTGYLNFQKLEEPFSISGRAGVLMKDRDRNKEWVEFEDPYKQLDFDER